MSKDVIRHLRVIKKLPIKNNWLFVPNFQTTEEEEAMELVPHITLNPSFNIDMLEYLEAEEDTPTDEHGRVGGASASSALFGDRSNLVDIVPEPNAIARPKR
jgi:hypothetical protein